MNEYIHHVHLREPSYINNMNEINVNEIRSEQVFLFPVSDLNETALPWLTSSDN